MKRRALLIASVGILGGCLQNGAENTQDSDGTDQDEDGNGTGQEDESNGTAEEPNSNTTNQDNTSNGTDQDDPTNRSDPTNESTETEHTDTSNGTTQDNATNGSAQEETGNGTDQDDHDRELRTYEVEAETSSDSPIRHEFEVTQPDIHSPDSPLTLTVSISNPTDETIVYGDTDNVVGSYLSSDEFILIPKGEYEYSFDEDTRIWVATETIAFPGALNMDELEPDQTRSQELVLIRTFDEDSPDTIPSAFEFTTPFEVGGEDTNMDTNEEYTVAFSLVAT